MKDESLKKHCQVKHNAAKRIAGKASVSGFFASSAKKSNPSESSSTSIELLLQSGGRKTPEDNILSRPETPLEGSDDVTEGYREGNKHMEASVEMKELIKTVHRIDFNSENSVKEIKFLKEHVDKLTNTLQRKHSEFKNPEDAEPLDERAALLRDCKTIDDILDTFEELVIDQESNTIICELCFENNTSKKGFGRGQFKLDQDDNDEDEALGDLESR